MTYSVEFTRAAAKGFRALPVKDKERISETVDGLADEPRPLKAKALRGRLDLLRIRVGKYRIVYQVEDDFLAVLVIAVGHRKDVYKKL